MKKGDPALFTYRASPRVYGSRHPTDVSNKQLAADIERGFRHFLNRRPELDRGRPMVVFGGKKKGDPMDVARAYLAIEFPRRGVLKGMCEGSGVSYTSVTVLCSKLRKERRAA